MGKIENKVKKRIKLGKIEKGVMGIMFGAGIVSLAVLAPNAMRLLKPAIKTLNSRNKKNYFSRVIGRLEKKGLVKIKRSEGRTWVELTPAGEAQALLINSGEVRIKNPKKWDKKWRVVIFDIKEKQRRKRDLFRLALKNLGFVELQQSVWVCPYDREDYISILKADLSIGKDILYMVADEIEADNDLKKRFGLKI